MTKNLWPFFSFYGGKWRSAPHYPTPEYQDIIEPFAGSAGYSVRYYDRNITLVEIDPVIAGVWRYLIEVSESELRALPLDPNNITSLPPEAQNLIGFWMNKGGASPGKSPSAWMRSGIRPNSYWGEVIRERIASQVKYIRHWNILEGSYEVSPNIQATWFIDPPYSTASGSLYKFSDINYELLSTWVHERQGQIMVCEQEGSDWLPFEPFGSFKSTPGVRGKGAVKEVIYEHRLAERD